MKFLSPETMDRLKQTAMVNAYCLLKIPLLAFITPEFYDMTDEKSVIKVRLGYRTRNHLNSMYFGALSMGAELSVVAPSLRAIEKSGKRIDFIFKDFEAQFLKRADGHILFTCSQAKEIVQLIEEAAQSSERLERKFDGVATVEGKNEPVMTYRLTLSVRRR